MSAHGALLRGAACWWMRTAACHSAALICPSDHLASFPPSLARRGKLFGCLQKQLAAPSYSAALAPWLDAFPHEQLLLVQAEALAADDSRLAALYEDLQQ